MLTISLLQLLVSLRKIFIPEKFREVSAHKPSKQPLIMEDIQEKYNHLLQQNEALRQENEELHLLLHAHGIYVVSLSGNKGNKKSYKISK